jgi:hypothetical protein
MEQVPRSSYLDNLIFSLNAQDSNFRRGCYDFENFQSAQRKLFSNFLTEKPRSASNTHLEDEDATEYFPPILYAARQPFGSNLQELWIPDSCYARLFLRNVVCTRGKLHCRHFPKCISPSGRAHTEDRAHQTSKVKYMQIIRKGT